MKKILLLLLFIPVISKALVNQADFIIAGKVYQVTVCNQLGQPVFNQDYDSVVHTTVHLKDMACGLYIVKVNGTVVGKVAATGVIHLSIRNDEPLGIW